MKKRGFLPLFFHFQIGKIVKSVLFIYRDSSLVFFFNLEPENNVRIAFFNKFKEFKTFIKELNKSNKEVWIRQVIIPDINDNKEYIEKLFKNIKHIDENGNEYWLARELGKVLEYGEYRKFLPSIKKAITSCEKSSQNVENHFVQMAVMVDIVSNAKRKLKDYKLTRYACYLIVQNSDSSK